MNIMKRKKIHNLQRHSINRFLASFKIVTGLPAKKAEYKIAAQLGTANLPKTKLVQQAQTQIELSRNTAALYAGIIPPR